MTGRRVAIHQPNYWPWIGYWRKMASCDVFVLFDDVQLPQGKSFVTRTRIKTQTGESWLTIPAEHKGGLPLISEARIAGNVPWVRKHWRTIEMSYRGAPFFDAVAPGIKAIYERDWERVVEINIACIAEAKRLLGLDVEVVTSSSLRVEAHGTDRILGIVEALGGELYVTGTGAGSARYMDTEAFRAKGIEVAPLEFEHPVYAQPRGAFVSNLSILDFLFNCGRTGWEEWMAQGTVSAL